MIQELLPFMVAGIVTGSILGLAGTGLVLTYKTSGILNFGQGAVAAAAAYGYYYLTVDHAWSSWAALLVIIVVVGGGFGLVMTGVARRLADKQVTLKVVATIGIILFVNGLASVKYGADLLLIDQFLPGSEDTFEVAGVIVTWSQVITVLISLALVVLLYAFFRFSRLGLSMRAVVDDPELVSLHGTNAVSVQRFSWIIGSALAALSGVLIAPITGIQATALVYVTVQAFGAAALGAFSSVPATYLGAMVIGIVASILTKYQIDVPALAGASIGLPFMFLIAALLVIPKRKLIRPSRPELPLKMPWQAPPGPRMAAGAVTLVLLCLMPQLVGINLSYVTIGLTQGLLLLSLGLLVRTAGLISLCQAAFAAVGAVAFAGFAGDMPWLLALFLAALVVVPVAAVLALPAIRLAGIYLALATFGFGLALEAIVYPREWFFGSTGGRAVPRPSGFESDTAYYYVVLASFVLVAVVMLLIHRSRLGRVLRGIGEAPLAMGTFGLNANLTRLIVFCISGFIAGLSGALYGAQVNFAVLGDAKFGSFSSLLLIAVLTLSPGREPWYAVVGVVAAVVPAYWTGETSSYWLNAVFGLSAVLVAMNGGIDPMPRVVQRWVERLSSRAKKRRAAQAEVVPREVGLRPPKAGSGLAIDGLTVRFGGRTAVDDLSLNAPTGHITGLIGPNGAGKTTTFNAISGLLRPSSGTVVLHGRDVSRYGPGRRGRLGLGRTFQITQLCDSLTVAENVGLGVEAGLAGSNVRGQTFATIKEAQSTKAEVDEALAICGVTHLRDVRAGALSTGQRRLVELARCLSGDFDILLLDEPSSGLDTVETAQFGTTLQQIVATRGCGILLVEHDMGLVLGVCEQVYVLDFGKLLFQGTPDEIRSSPVVHAAYLGQDDEVIAESEQPMAIAEEVAR